MPALRPPATSAPKSRGGLFEIDRLPGATGITRWAPRFGPLSHWVGARVRSSASPCRVVATLAPERGRVRQRTDVAGRGGQPSGHDSTDHASTTVPARAVCVAPLRGCHRRSVAKPGRPCSHGSRCRGDGIRGHHLLAPRPRRRGAPSAYARTETIARVGPPRHGLSVRSATPG